MLVYHPAYDLYNCIFRMFSLLINTNEDDIPLDKLRIWDFYLTFPNLIKNITFPNDLKPLKIKLSRKHENPYEDLVDPKQIFDRMSSYQLSAIKCLAVYGFINSDLLQKNIIKKTDKKIPEEIVNQISNISYEKSNVIKLLTNDFINLPFFGEKGLKERTQLINYKYDPK